LITHPRDNQTLTQARAWYKPDNPGKTRMAIGSAMQMMCRGESKKLRYRCPSPGPSSSKLHEEKHMSRQITYAYPLASFSISVAARTERIRESIRDASHELQYSNFRSSCASDRDLVECSAQGRLADFVRQHAALAREVGR
jgi:hypothetical protein